MLPQEKQSFLSRIISLLPYLICFVFFIAYSVLGITRQQHYQSYGYDLGINDQVVWRYAHLQAPLDTIAPYSDRTKFAEHIELIFAFISPFYWLWSSPIMLILMQAGVVCGSAIFSYLLARKYMLPQLVSLSILIAYLMFYGVQFGLWTDVHSSVFAAAFLMVFIYFLDTKKYILAFLFFLLTLTAKESTGTALFFVSLVYFLLRRDKYTIVYMIISVMYVLFAFFIFFPYIMHIPYLYANHRGILSNLNPYYLIDNWGNRTAIFYSFASWGFLPLFSPLVLLPIFSHFYKFFVIASDLTGAQGLFGQYRIMLTPVLALGTIWTCKKVPQKTHVILGIWLLITTVFAQYALHLPLSYLTKQWFWSRPVAVSSINTMIHEYLPTSASVVSQNNIIPHISERDRVYTLFPEKKIFRKNSPCGAKECDWYRWDGSPQFLLVDTSGDWDIRHLLVQRSQFVAGLQNLEKVGIITVYKKLDTTILYRVHQNLKTYNNL